MDIAIDETKTKILVENNIGGTVWYTVFDKVTMSNRLVMNDINSFPVNIEGSIFTKIQKKMENRNSGL